MLRSCPFQGEAGQLLGSFLLYDDIPQMFWLMQMTMRTTAEDADRLTSSQTLRRQE
jgi:hypothetical protein